MREVNWGSVTTTTKINRSKRKKKKTAESVDLNQLTIEGIDQESKTTESQTVETTNAIEATSVGVPEDPKAEEIVGPEISEVDLDNKPDDSLISRGIATTSEYFLQKNRELQYAQEHPYVASRNVLTNAELTLFKLMNAEFNSKLRCINRSVVIVPKIRLADLVNLNPALPNNTSALYKIACKHVDFTVCDYDTMCIICTVELDDYYHSRQDKIDRDIFVNNTLRDCGIQLFRVDKPIKDVGPEDIAMITNYILECFAPTCTECGKLMEPKRSRFGKRPGHRFYGCSGWRFDGSGCSFTIDIE